MIRRNEEQMVLEYILKKCVLTKNLAFLSTPLFPSLAASLKPLRDCALFDSYSEPLPGSQQTRDFSRLEVRRREQSSSLAECRGIGQLHSDCGMGSSRSASL